MFHRNGMISVVACLHHLTPRRKAGGMVKASAAKCRGGDGSGGADIGEQAAGRQAAGIVTFVIGVDVRALKMARRKK